MNEARHDASLVAAMSQILRFWQALLRRIGPRRVIAASLLELLTGVSEGLALLVLVPLLQTLDGGATASSGAVAWLPRLLQGFGVTLNLTSVLALFVGLAAGRSLLHRLTDLHVAGLRLDFLADTRIGLYSAIAHANWSFLRRKRPAELLSALTSETDRLEDAVYFALQLPGRIVTIVAHVLAAWLIAPRPTLAALAVGLLLMWLVRGQMLRSLRLGEALSAVSQDYHHVVSEFVAGLKIAKSYVAEDRYVAAFAAAVNNEKTSVLSFTESQGNARLAQELAGALSVAFFLAISVETLRIPMAQVLVLALIFYRLLPLAQGLQQSAQQLLHLAPAAQSVLGLSSACVAAREPLPDRPRQIFEVNREICFDHVSFRHFEGASQALNNVSFSLPARSLTILTGPSGAGKSTLLDLLAGLLQPDQGEIRIDDRPLTGDMAKAWRYSIGYVMQEPFLFHASIRDNLMVARPDASERELLEALRLAGAGGFVDALPQRLETVVGDRGARFSGGERQRLALARALLRKPALLILDEPTSALDAGNEQMVLEGIEGLRGRLTMLLVTHRPERIKAADQTLDLENGVLVPSGTFRSDADVACKPGH